MEDNLAMRGHMMVLPVYNSDLLVNTTMYFVTLPMDCNLCYQILLHGKEVSIFNYPAPKQCNNLYDIPGVFVAGEK